MPGPEYVDKMEDKSDKLIHMRFERGAEKSEKAQPYLECGENKRDRKSTRLNSSHVD